MIRSAALPVLMVVVPDPLFPVPFTYNLAASLLAADGKLAAIWCQLPSARPVVELVMDALPKSSTAAPDPLSDNLNRVPVPAAPYCRSGLFAVEVLNQRATVRPAVPLMPVYP